MDQLIVGKGSSLHGRIRVPGDKSISHRTLLLGALAEGDSVVRGFLPSGDCMATLRCIEALGIQVEEHGDNTLTIQGRGLRGLCRPDQPLDCVRSGTTMRLLAGILAGQSFASTLTGDEQLLRRPMGRIAEPLRKMGAQITTRDGRGPLKIRPAKLHGGEHTLPVASAQVKSAILLAGLYAEGPTVVQQPGPARDHTELMLAAMGADVRSSGLTVTLTPRSRELSPLDLSVPGDVSSASFPLVAALLVASSEVMVEWVGVNPTRTGLLDVVSQMGAEIAIDSESRQGGEPMANVTAAASDLKGIEIGGSTVVRMIDEFPLLAVAATQAKGATVVRDAAELRVKETDRIACIASELSKMGAHIEPERDGFTIVGPTPLEGALVDSHGDHRIAMALAVAGLVASGETIIDGARCIPDSFPGFVERMQEIGARMEWVWDRGDCHGPSREREL